jgi:hypothetical protein
LFDLIVRSFVLLMTQGSDELKKVQVPLVKEKLDNASNDADASSKSLKRAVKRMGELEGNVLIAQALMELEMLKATVENAEVMASQGQLPFDHRLDALASAIKVQKGMQRGRLFRVISLIFLFILFV